MIENRSKLYEALAGEKDVVKKLKYFDKQISALENVLQTFYEADIYSDLSVEDKVKYDIFLSYSLTSLYWMYSRTIGEDPNGQPVKEEVQRVQEYMRMYQNIKDRKTAPRIDNAAAKRFIRSGLFDLENLKKGKRKVFNEEQEEENAESSEPPSKKTSAE